jgi:DNA-binding MarR family transcriptional regulator
MSRRLPDRKALIAALEQAMRKASAQGVLFSQLVATRLGMNSTDLECLDIIALRGPVTAGEIAAATGLTTGAVTGVIDRLEKLGFARRESDAADRRKVLVRSQPAALRRIGPMFEPMQRAFNAAIADYGEKELALLVEFLTRAYEEAVTATAALQKKLPRAAKRGRRGPSSS